MDLQFLGAAGSVTGSKHLIDTGEAKILVDCGLFQGSRHLRNLNWSHLPVDPKEIDAVLITHAHLDHVGYLPVLIRHGFRGRILATKATSRLMLIVLADSGRLQEEEAAYANRKGYSKHHPAEPLYTEEEAIATAERVRSVAMNESISVVRGVEATWTKAGHILGSATVTVRTADGHSVQFSGDLGRQRHPLLLPPDPPGEVGTLVVESTYGDRHHEPEELSLEKLADTVKKTLHRGGTIVIPAFAVDRTEVILFQLGRLVRSGALPRVPVYVDSPMALSVLKVYRDAIGNGDSELRPEILTGEDPFAAAGELHESRTVEESRAVNQVNSAIIIASSGMATGGRVLHHLAQRLPDRRNCVILVGYQSPGTRGQLLEAGARVLKMLGRYVPVNAEILEVGGFSVHADSDELVEWMAAGPVKPRQTFVVHGEANAAQSLRGRVMAELRRHVVVPAMNDRVTLT